MRIADAVLAQFSQVVPLVGILCTLCICGLCVLWESAYYELQITQHLPAYNLNGSEHRATLSLCLRSEFEFTIALCGGLWFGARSHTHCGRPSYTTHTFTTLHCGVHRNYLWLSHRKFARGIESDASPREHNCVFGSIPAALRFADEVSPMMERRRSRTNSNRIIMGWWLLWWWLEGQCTKV